MLSFLKSFSSNIHGKYSVSQKESFRIGPWRVYDAKSRATKELVSVFVLDKKALTERLADAGVRSKSRTTAEVYDFASRGVTQLAKLRHPAIVKLVEPLEQGRNSMAFVTERVTTSLQPLVKAKAAGAELEAEELDEISIERGLALLTQGLLFLHEQLGYVFMSVSPESVLVDAAGDWKLFGLEFLENYREHTGKYYLPQLDPRLPTYVHPNLDYMAPELVLDHQLGPKNDVFSLACLAHAVYTGHAPMSTRSNPNSYREEYSRASRKLQALTSLGRMAQPLISQLFERKPEERITLEQFANSEYFNNSLVKALQFLDEFSTKGTSEKIQFLKYFSGVVDQVPRSLRQRKVLKFAVQELKGRDSAIGELVGALVFKVAYDMSRLTFSEQILPIFSQLKDFSHFREAVVGDLPIIVKCTTDKDFTAQVLPLLLVVLEPDTNGSAPLQKSLLDQTGVYLENVQVAGLELKLFPVVLSLFAATPAKSVKIACLRATTVMVEKGLSKSLIQDKLLKALVNMKTRDPEVIVAVQALYRALSGKVLAAVVMESVLPHLQELAMGKDLTVDQFKSLMSMIRKELDGVEISQIEVIKNNRDMSNEKKNGEVSEAKPTTDFFNLQKETPSSQPAKSSPWTSWEQKETPSSQPVKSSPWTSWEHKGAAAVPAVKTSKDALVDESLLSFDPLPAGRGTAADTPVPTKPSAPVLGTGPSLLQPPTKSSPWQPLQPAHRHAGQAGDGDDFGAFGSSAKYDSLL